MTTTAILTRTELESLVDRLNARSESKLLSDQPELQRDLTLAVKVIRALTKDQRSSFIDVNQDIDQRTASHLLVRIGSGIGSSSNGAWAWRAISARRSELCRHLRSFGSGRPRKVAPVRFKRRPDLSGVCDSKEVGPTHDVDVWASSDRAQAQH
jgi:hypothetical protein